MTTLTGRSEAIRAKKVLNTPIKDLQGKKIGAVKDAGLAYRNRAFEYYDMPRNRDP